MNAIDQSINLSEFTDTISIIGFFFKLFVVSLLSYLLGLVYLKFGKSLSNRSVLANSFPLLGLATMSTITVVKSSLALSLGLVGALSIVRFRTPIKDPEELIYLFLCITIGLATGADQYFVSLAIVLGVLILNLFLRKTSMNINSKEGSFNVFIVSDEKIEFSKIINILKKHCRYVNLRRFSGIVDESNNDICFSIILRELSDLVNLQSDLRKLSPNIKFDFIDTSKIQG